MEIITLQFVLGFGLGMAFISILFYIKFRDKLKTEGEKCQE